ncbi:Ankyrin [Mycena sanguinolenta]|uniref:Ankyrin n=1 Tax=Mycena sanguinolenta TaxID=230812 RepID=A0A8H7D3I1_9AGAR|nr:Ankyrin [Mycena sanguinolenta]
MSETGTKPDPTSLSPAAIEFAHRMFDAARTGNSELLLAAVDAGLPVNILDTKGKTLVFSTTLVWSETARSWSSASLTPTAAGHLDLTKKLLERGGDPNLLNGLGQSIIAGAVFKGHDDVVRALAEKGADSRLGKPTAIQIAHMFKRTQLMDLLGATDADVGPEVPTPVPQASSA